jgi:small-conductance mechanosensitive channel
MDTEPSVADLQGLYEQAAAWLSANLLQGGEPVQLVAIAAAWLAARLLVHRLRPHVEKRLARSPAAARGARRSAATTLARLVVPLVWLVLLWFSMVALEQAGQPARLVSIAATLLGAWLAVRLTTSLLADVFWCHLFAAVVVVGAALKMVGLWDPTLHILDEMSFTVGSVRLSARGLIEAALILGVLLIVASAAARLLNRWVERFPQITPSGRVLLDKSFRFTALALAFIIALHAIGVDLTTLAVFSGAVGVGVGFGLQKVFSNLVSGMILLLDRSVKPGDVIAVGSDYGWINALGARYVSVVTRDGIEHLIPNEELITERVENWSHSSNLLRLRLPFGIDYDADLEQALALAQQAPRGVARVLADPPPKCLVIEFADSAVNMELRFWIGDPRNGVESVKSDVARRIWQLFHQHGIAFPYPQRDLHLKTATPVPVRVLQNGEGDGC